jgi:RNA polymerase sigma-70 factor (ECF subfamily)
MDRHPAGSSDVLGNFLRRDDVTSELPVQADGVEIPAIGRELAERDLLQLYAENRAGLLRYATAMTRSRDQAQDAIQEIFLRYYSVRLGGTRIENGRAWLFTVLRNYILDRLKEAGSAVEVGIEKLRNLPGPVVNMESGIERAELARRIVRRLSPRELDCLRLRAEGLAYREIGIVMGIRSGTVGALLARAVKKLRHAMASGKRSQ